MVRLRDVLGNLNHRARAVNYISNGGTFDSPIVSFCVLDTNIGTLAYQASAVQ